MGSDQYPRLRFGAGNNFPKGAQVHFVLGKWESEEEADETHDAAEKERIV